MCVLVDKIHMRTSLTLEASYFLISSILIQKMNTNRSVVKFLNEISSTVFLPICQETYSIDFSSSVL